MKTLQALLEMAKRSTPAQFYELAKKKYGAEKVKALKWPEIVAISKEHEVLIPPYLRSQKVGRGTFNLVPPDHDDAKAKTAPKEEPKKPSPDAVKASVARMVDTAMKDSKPAAPKEEPKKEYKMPPLSSVSYHDWSEMYQAMKKKFGEFELERVPHGIQRHGRHGAQLGTKLLVNKKTGEVMGYWDVHSADMVPGRGFVAYGSGQLATGEKPKEEPKVAQKAERKGGEATAEDMKEALGKVKDRMRWADKQADYEDIEKSRNGFEFSVRYWGHWEGDDGSGDYDHQSLSRESSKKLKAIIDEVEGIHKKVKLDWQTGEKNWIYVSAR